jgi:hypothetical protein
MHARSRKYVATLAVVPLVASVGLIAASPSTAAGSRQQVMTNGTFESGRTGWFVSKPRTRAVVVHKGYRGSKAIKLANRRSGPAILSSRKNVARSTKAGQRYTVSALVRTSQPGVRARLVLRESANGRTLKNTVKAFRATRTWRKVSMNATTRRAGSVLNVRLAFRPLRKHKVVLIDNVSVLKWLAASGPTNPGPNPPGPGPTDPPGNTAGRLTNGCAYNARGIPGSCGAYLGAAYGGNADPTQWEASMSKNLGVRRTFWGGSSVDKAVSTAKGDLAKHRLPWISFKLPHSWSDMAAGKGDAWVRGLATKLAALDGPVWLAFHHEPEGDGNIKQWTAMQAHLAPIVRSIAPNVAYTIVLTGYHQYYGEAQYSLESLWPKNTKIDLAGFDIYNQYGVVKDGKKNTKGTDMVGQYFSKLKTWSDKTGVPWGIAETGYTNEASEDDPQWVNRTYTELKQYGGKAFSYFNTNLNSIANWELNTQLKKNQYAAALRDKPTL